MESVIEVVCSNGHRIKAKLKLAGKTVACPKCGVRITVPQPVEPSEEFVKATLVDSNSLDAVVADTLQVNANTPDTIFNDLSLDDLSIPAVVVLPPKSTDGSRGAANKYTNSPERKLKSNSSSSKPSGNKRTFLIVGAGAGFCMLAITVISAFYWSSSTPGASILPSTLANVATSETPKSTQETNDSAVAQITGSKPLIAADAGVNRPAEQSPQEVADKPKLPVFVDATMNDIKEPDSHFLEIDKRFRVWLDQKPKKMKFFLAKRGQEPPSNTDEWISVKTVKEVANAKQNDLTLLAAMTESQSVIILQEESFAKLKTLVLPVTIQIGSEVLQIVALDDSKEIAGVRRSSGVFHNVDEPIRILPQGDDLPMMTNEGIPFLEDSVLNWFPSTQSAGEGTIYLSWTFPDKRGPIRFRWDVTIADARSIELIVPEKDSMENPESVPLSGESWPWKVAATKPPTTNESKVEKGNKEIEKEIKKIAQKSATRILAKFSQILDGERTITVEAGEGSTPKTISVTAGAGVPMLLEADSKSKSLVEKVSPPETSQGDVLVSEDAERALSVQWLNGLPVAGNDQRGERTLDAGPEVREFQCVTSADGKKLYLLGARTLVVLDTLSMKAELAVRFKARCLDVSLCSEGVLVTTETETSRDLIPIDSVVLRQHRTTPRPSSHLLYVFDPKTLKVKKVYGLPLEMLASHESSSIVSVHQDQSCDWRRGLDFECSVR